MRDRDSARLARRRRNISKNDGCVLRHCRDGNRWRCERGLQPLSHRADLFQAAKRAVWLRPDGGIFFHADAAKAAAYGAKSDDADADDERGRRRRQIGCERDQSAGGAHTYCDALAEGATTALSTAAASIVSVRIDLRLRRWAQDRDVGR
jgi:hypothetical protein